jgi:transposase-like protein
MTNQDDLYSFKQVTDSLAQNVWGAIPELISILVNKAMAEELLQSAIQKYAASAPRLSAWLEDNLAEGLMLFVFPLEYRWIIRNTKKLERINKEIHRRTRVVGSLQTRRPA